MSDLKKFNSDLMLPKTQSYLNSVLGNEKNSFVNNIVALVSSNVKLQECETPTIMFAALKATALKLPLDPNLGYAFIIPFRDNKNNVTVATFQIGAKGFVQLAMRSGQFKTVNVTDVRDGEIIKTDRLTGEITFDWKDNRDELPIIGYVAYMKLINGFEKSMYMTSNEIAKHGQKFSKTYKFGLWQSDFSSMAEKTVLKRLLSKYAPLSVDMQNAIRADQAVIDESGEKYLDSPENEASEKATNIFKSALEAKTENASTETLTDEQVQTEMDKTDEQLRQELFKKD